MMADKEEIQELERRMTRVATAMTTTDVARALASLENVDLERSDRVCRQAELVFNKLEGDYEELLMTWDIWCSKKGLVDIPEEGEFGTKWMDDQDPALRMREAVEKFNARVGKAKSVMEEAKKF